MDSLLSASYSFPQYTEQGLEIMMCLKQGVTALINWTKIFQEEEATGCAYCPASYAIEATTALVQNTLTDEARIPSIFTVTLARRA